MEGRYKADAVVRVLFFDLLKKRYSEMNGHDDGHREVDGLGVCRQNKQKLRMLKNEGVHAPRGNDRTFGYQGVRDGAVKLALKYKFMISMENSRTKGYVVWLVVMVGEMP